MKNRKPTIKDLNALICLESDYLAYHGISATFDEYDSARGVLTFPSLISCWSCGSDISVYEASFESKPHGGKQAADVRLTSSCQECHKESEVPALTVAIEDYN